MLAREGVTPATDADLDELERRLSAFAFPSFDRDIVERVLLRLRDAEAARPAATIPAPKPVDDPFATSWRKNWNDGWNACVAEMVGGTTKC